MGTPLKCSPVLLHLSPATRILNKNPDTSEIFFSTQEGKLCISKQPCNVLLFYYTNTNEIIPNHFTLKVFWRDLLCSLSNGDHMRITCYLLNSPMV